MLSLSSGRVMDRLLSGDVGFNKTSCECNVSCCFRWIFQALFYCPTTLLASQHFHGIQKGLKEFGINVAKLDGKTSTKEKQVLKKSTWKWWYSNSDLEHTLY